MSAKQTNYKAATDAKVDAAIAEVDGKVVVPEQKTGEPTLADKINEVVADVAAAVKTKPGTALSVTVKLDENDNLEIQVDEATQGKVKKLVAGAKGVLQRNKKLVAATAGLLATSVLLKVLAARRDELEADEVVESSDDVSTEA